MTFSLKSYEREEINVKSNNNTIMKKYQVNERGQLIYLSAFQNLSCLSAEAKLHENISLMYEMNKKFFASQDCESLKVVIVAIMKSI